MIILYTIMKHDRIDNSDTAIDSTFIEGDAESLVELLNSVSTDIKYWVRKVVISKASTVHKLIEESVTYKSWLSGVSNEATTSISNDLYVNTAIGQYMKLSRLPRPITRIHIAV